ncbi:30S ribosomal protein S4 [Candidatus Aerophobetes bacterium]|nr:30S ribosomal protein S4 [Candidatus Aerophobetes bacterium]
MGLSLESKCVRCRRLNTKLFLKGEKCFTKKCALERRKRGPVISERRMSQYARQLREKQKLRLKYGVTETQFERYYEKAERMSGLTGEELLRLLERRLDNVVWRMGFCSSRSQARQFITHGHFLVNGRKVKVPSYLVNPEDIVEPTEKAKKFELIKQNIKNSSNRAIPGWLEVDTKSLVGKVVRLPEKEELDQEVDVSLVVEYYSR